MGEPKPQELIITHHFADLDVVVNLVTALAEARSKPDADALREAYEAGYANGKQDGADRPNAEPWRFHSPSAGADVAAYLDDHNQVRHVPTTRVTDVPKHWRRIYVDRTDA